MSRHHPWQGVEADESLARAIEQSVGLVDHDPQWAARFDEERARLMQALPGAFVDIVHIGSTPIAGLQAKPIIDLLAGVPSMEAAFALAGPLCSNGYAASSEFNQSMSDRQFYMRHAAGLRTHHLHLVVHDSQAWHDRVAFSHMLQVDADLRARYEQLKIELAERHKDDREAYTEGKSDFIRAAVARKTVR